MLLQQQNNAIRLNELVRSSNPDNYRKDKRILQISISVYCINKSVL